MLKSSNLYFLILCASMAMGRTEDFGFLNAINGTGRTISFKVNSQLVNQAMSPGSMTGGMLVPAGKIVLEAEAEGLKTESEPIQIEKEKSNLVVVGVFTNQEDPPTEFFRIKALPYVETQGGGMTASLVYAGKDDFINVSVGKENLILKRYEHKNLGSVSPNFNFRIIGGAEFKGDFREQLHYTIVILDGAAGEFYPFLVVPNVKFSAPTF